MRPALWMRATFYVSLFTGIVAVGAVAFVAADLRARADDRRAAADMAASIRAQVDDMRAEIDAAGIRAQVDNIRAEMSIVVGHTEDRRVTALRAIQAFSGREFILFLGDSITEGADLPAQICGLPVVNAGIGGSRASDFIPFAEDIFSNATPTVTVVALGINDAQIQYWNKSKEQQFRASYDLLLDMIPAGAMLMTPTPVETSKKYSGRYPAAAWSAINLEIRDAAVRRDATLIDLSPVVSGTIDGVHLNAPSYDSWREIVAGAIKKKLGC